MPFNYRSKNNGFCQRCGELSSELDKSKATILDLRRECQLLKKQLRIFQASNDEQLQGIEQIEFDQYMCGENDNNHAADVKYEDTKIWITTNDAAVTTFDTPFSVQHFEIVKCVDVIDPNVYLKKESSIEISEDTTAAKLISTISNAQHFESKLTGGKLPWLRAIFPHAKFSAIFTHILHQSSYSQTSSVIHVIKPLKH